MLAIARSDARITLSYRLQVLMSVGSVLVLLTGLYYVSQLVGVAADLGPYRGRYFEFALVGFLLITFVTVSLGAFSQRIAAEQRAGTLEVLLATATPLTTLLPGMFLVPLLRTAVSSGVYVGVATAVFGARFGAGGVAPALVVLALTVAVFYAVGLLGAAVIVVAKRGDVIGAVVGQATTFLAGAVFPVAMLPEAAQALVRLFPAYYALNGLRQALILDGGWAAVADEVAVLSAFAAGLLPLATWCFARALRLARTLGTLGNY